MTLEERLARLEERLARLEEEVFGVDYESAREHLDTLMRKLREAAKAGDTAALRELERVAASEYTTLCERVVGA